MEERAHRPREEEGTIAYPPSWEPGARSRLMAAMAASVAQQGLLGTRVEDVLLLAHASRRTFYECFDNREACFAATYDAIRDDLREALSDHAGGLEGALHSVLSYFATWPSHARLVTSEIYAFGPEGLRRHERSMAELALRLRRCPDAAQAPDSPLGEDDLGHAAVGALHRIVLRRLAARQEATLPELAPALAALFAGDAAERSWRALT